MDSYSYVVEVVVLVGVIQLRSGPDHSPVSPTWAGTLLGLGARLARFSGEGEDRLTVGVTVPNRTIASLLIGLGWLVTQREGAPRKFNTEDLPSTGTRVVLRAGRKILVETFHGAKVAGPSTRVHIGGSSYEVGPQTQLVACDSECESGSHHIPAPGSFLRTFGHVERWEALQLSTSTKLMVVGTRSWLDSDAQVEISAGGEDVGWSPLSEVLHLKSKERATWATEFIPSSSVASEGIPDVSGLLILDGHQAATWIAAADSPLTVVVLDRSSPQEAGYFSLLQARAVRTPIRLSEVGWPSYTGIEALAFKEEA